MTDSLNAHLGLAREQLLAQKPMAKGLQLCDELEQLQSALIDLGAAVATPPGSSDPEQLARVAFNGEVCTLCAPRVPPRLPLRSPYKTGGSLWRWQARVSLLERWIDGHEDELPPLRTFVLPGGGAPH